MGQGAGLSNYALGQLAGSETVTLNTQQMPQHQHFANAVTSPGDSATPGSSVLLANEGPQGIAQVFTYAPYDQTNQTALAAGSIGATGGSQPHENRQPFLTIQYCIATVGVFPAQN